MSTDATTLLAQRLVPASILRLVHDRAIFFDGIRSFVKESDDDLLRSTETCLRNMGRLDREDDGPDAWLRVVLVPELWIRIRPSLDLRAHLRRISSTLAEYDPDKPSIFRFSQFWSAGMSDCLRQSSDRLRAQIAEAEGADVDALVERARFAMAASQASASGFSPDCPVYEPAFTYRLVPAIAIRMLARRLVGDPSLQNEKIA